MRANGSEEASAIAVVLHELQVNEAAPAAGMFSWKKVRYRAKVHRRMPEEFYVPLG